MGRALLRTWPLFLAAGVVAWLLGPASDYEAFLFNTFLAYLVASVGTVFLVGWSGQVSFAQAAFFGIGAYTTAHLARGIDPPLPVTVLMAATCAAAFALPMAIPAVRLRGVFLALATLAYQAAIERFLFRQIWFTLGGEAIPISAPHLVGSVTLDDQRALALAVLPLAVAVYLAVHGMRRSKLGRALVGMHRREGAMAACGIAIPRYRLLAFVAAAWTAGAGGSLLTFALTSAPGSNEYTIVKSTVLLAIPVIGGITRLGGAVVGSALFVGMPELIRRLDVQNFNISAVMGLGLFLVAVAFRGGVVGVLQRARERERDRFGWLGGGRQWRSAAVDRTTVQLGAPVRVTLANGVRLRITPNGRSVSRRRVAAPGAASAPGGESAGEEASTADLRVADLTVNFGRVKALDAVSLRFRAGVVFGVMGPNGAGKTTLLNALTGAVPITRGEVWLGERRIDRLAPWKRRAVGIARTFQRCELVPELSVEDNVLIGAHLRLRLVDELLRRSGAVRADMESWLARFGIGPELWPVPVATLPYGWQRRVEIVRALVAEPEFLLLDEPVAGMNADESLELGSLVREWVAATGRGAVLVEHDVDLVAEICDEVHVLDFGRLIASGTPAQVLADRAVVEAYLGLEAVG